ncbi:class I adenylate-forming enzyme family protein [Streptomyces sp. NPDC020747]|uniref:class I adenylate-forming enzyme family protein n=1 Tax=Streptomyces sp. NPDC020747 TaxID=3365086 RepID=UPI0037B1930D
MTTTNMMPVADGTAPGSSLEPLAGLVGGPRVDHLLTAAARRAPDRVALRSATEEISYAALEALTDRCAAMVQGLVDGPGEVVAIAGLMDPEFAPLFFGISRAGNASAVLNPFLPAERLAHVLTTSGARVAVLSPEMYERIAEVRGRAPLLETVVLTRRTEGLDALPTLDELLAAAPGSADPAGVTEDPDALACLQFTSGTTGSAKACRLSHRNLTVNAAQTVYAQQVDESSVVFNCLPTFHLMHLTLAVTAVATHVLWPGADSVASVRAADRLRATHYYSLPVRLSRLAADPLLTGLEAPALRAILSGGSSLPKQAALALAQQFGVPVVQGYGLAETSPSMHLGTPDRPKPGSCGQAVPGGETRIIDVDTREVLPAGAKGEIQVRGPQLMQGYLGRSLDQDTDADGWFSTGDVGVLDEEGFLFWTDRIKDTFKCDNWLVSPTEIERVLLRHPAVEDCVVLDTPDEERGAVACALVVPRDRGAAAPDDFAAYVNPKVPYYEELRRVVLVDTIPRSATGKVERRLLRDRLLAGELG